MRNPELQSIAIMRSSLLLLTSLAMCILPMHSVRSQSLDFGKYSDLDFKSMTGASLLSQHTKMAPLRVADIGPADAGHEIHAKMEEAVERALTIINSAAKFAQDAELEQDSLNKANKGTII